MISLKDVLIGLAIVISAVMVHTFAPVESDSASQINKPKTFDHSQCQYPDRTTNPPNGCDNSDPCDPANVKGGSGECSDAVTAPEINVIPMEGK